MTYIENILASVFSVNVGDTEEQQRAYLRSISDNPDTRHRDALRAEFGAALADPDYGSAAAFDQYEVYPAQGQTPREFVLERIWAPLFGPETAPIAA